MAGKIIDITGNRYGMLIVLGLDHVEKGNNKNKYYWKCKCDCGNECVRTKQTLNEKGKVHSCGCYKLECAKENQKKCAEATRGRIIDKTGQKYGRLTVLRLDHRKGYSTYWKCICDCGNECVRRSDRLHETSSCGCYTIECVKENQKKCVEATRGKENLSTKTHGDSKTRFYNIYQKAKSRCNNPNDNCYTHYGARGIKFLWSSYEEFKKDMYQSYLDHCEKYGEKNTSIDRIDVNGNYCKENCRWATQRLQVNNRSITVYVEMQDDTLYPLSVFSEKYNISIAALRKRYEKSKYYGTHRIPVNQLLNDDEIKLIKDKDIV